MKKKINNPSAPKKVSADNKTSKQGVNNNYSLPFEPKSLDLVRKALGLQEEAEPKYIFYFMLGKDICSSEMLKEMFALNDENLPRVFDENRNVYYDARWILELNEDYDRETGEFIPINFSPAQKKLRFMLLKIVLVDRFELLMEDLEEEYGIELYDEYDNLLEENTITEEELLDALQTYQNEHRNL